MRPADCVEMTSVMSGNRKHRYSISVSAETYDRAREVVVDGSLAAFVNGIVDSALSDPKILARVVAQCQPRRPEEN